MQLDYKDIIIKHYALSMSGSEIARQTGFSKSGVNDFLRAFKKCEDLNYPLPAGITNYGIALKVYGSVPGSGGRNENIELPDYEEDAKLMATRKNMTLVFLWNRYKKKCEEEGARCYQYSQYCELYNKWSKRITRQSTLMPLSHKKWKLTLLVRPSQRQILLPARS